MARGGVELKGLRVYLTSLGIWNNVSFGMFSVGLGELSGASGLYG